MASPVAGGAEASGAAAAPAGWWRRVGARVVDGFVVLVVSAIVGAIVYALMVGAAPRANGIPGVRVGSYAEGHPVANAVVAFLGLVIAVVYEAHMLNRYGATLGKMVAGIRVVPADAGTWRGLPLRTSVVRALTWWLPGDLTGVPIVGWLFWIFWVLNALFPLWDRPFHQSLNDKVARTRVIRAAMRPR